MPKKLSIIIPVYNESTYISRCLNNVCQVSLPGWQKEIIAINDGSTDNSLKLLKSFAKQYPTLKIIDQKVNQGKGAALQSGIQQASGQVVIIQDADLEYDPIDYVSILKKYDTKSVNVVYGSRILGAKIYHNYSANTFFLWGGLCLTKLINIFLKTNLTDQPTCYKSWRNNLSPALLEFCHCPGFEFEVEMTAFFSKIGSIAEVPIHYYPRTISHGKKIRFADFLKSLATLWRCRLAKISPSSLSSN